MPIPMVTIAIALLPVVIMMIPSFGRPPAVHGLLIFVLPMPKAVVWFEGAEAMGVARAEGGRRERGVRRMGVVH